MRPQVMPLGLQLSRTGRLVSRAFEEALAAAGGSLPVWLVLLNLKIARDANQRQLADAVGVSEATLTHHLNSMEKAGLLARSRDPLNRRNHVIVLTEAGEGTFARLRTAAVSFDRQLRAGFEATELDALGSLLNRLAVNVAPTSTGSTWPELMGATDGDV